jgi:hypothetical protein
MGKGIPHQRLEEVNVCFTHEMVGCADRGFPHLYNAWKVFRVYRKNV